MQPAALTSPRCGTCTSSKPCPTCAATHAGRWGALGLFTQKAAPPVPSCCRWSSDDAQLPQPTDRAAFLPAAAAAACWAQRAAQTSPPLASPRPQLARGGIKSNGKHAVHSGPRWCGERRPSSGSAAPATAARAAEQKGEYKEVKPDVSPQLWSMQRMKNGCQASGWGGLGCKGALLRGLIGWQ